MLKDKINTYEPSIDQKHSDDGTVLGINLISNVVTPAIKIRGVAFKNQESNTKDLRFKDEKKLRIAGPVLVPGDIYRSDDDEDYFIKFTIENIVLLVKDFMSKLPSRSKEVFNYDHKNEMVDSYLLEAILVDSDAKREMIKSVYSIDVPLGTFFIVQQFNDEKDYNRIVESGATSFSFEGFLGTELIKDYQFKEDNIKINKNNMKNKKKLIGVKRVLMSASKKVKFEEVAENEELIVVADEFKEGEEAVVIEDVAKGSIDDFTGEVDVKIDDKDKVLIIEEGKIVEIAEGDKEEVKEEVKDDKPKDEVKDEVKDEDKKDVKLEDTKDEDTKDEDKKEVKDTKLETDSTVDPVVETEEGISNSELFELLSEIKTELSEIKASLKDTDKEDDNVVDVTEQKFYANLSRLNEKRKSNK